MMLRWQTYDPWREIRSMQRQMDDILRGLLPTSRRTYDSYGPAFNVRDDGPAYRVEAEVPGLTKNDIHIEATSNAITIRGKREASKPEGYSVHRRERGNLEFARTLTFENKIDLEKVSASLHDGVLHLEVQKLPEAQPRQIAIKS